MMVCHKYLLLLIVSFQAVVFSESLNPLRELEIVVDQIGDSFKGLIEKQIIFLRNNSSISDNERNVIANYETNMKRDWDSLNLYLFEEPDVIKMQASNNVCETGISHLQSIEKLYYQYIITGNRYMFSQNIIYNIREYADKDRENAKRDIFNYNLRTNIRRGSEHFEEVMKNSSTEYWLCDPTQSIDPSSFFPQMEEEHKEGSSDCEEIQRNGYQCIPTHKNRKCDCIKSTIAINLVMAKADPGYVITGAQLTIDDHILGIAAKQAKLLPNGQIDKNTIKLVPQEKGDRATYADFVLRKNMMLLGKATIPKDRYLTEIGFQKDRQDFYLRAVSTKFDFDKKELLTNDTTVEHYETKGSVRGTKFSRAINIEKSSKGEITGVHWTNRIYPLIDNRMVESSSPIPLSGISLFIRGNSENEGFLAIKINTREAVSVVPKVPLLYDFPVQTILNTLSDITFKLIESVL